MTTIQTDLFYDYRHQFAIYPSWQAWLRSHRPPPLVVWGRFDASFAVAGADAYGRDVPDAEIHLLDAGHFALDEKADEIAEIVRNFLKASFRTRCDLNISGQTAPRGGLDYVHARPRKTDRAQSAAGR